MSGSKFCVNSLEPTASATIKWLTCMLKNTVTVRDVWVADNTHGSKIWRSGSERVAVSHTASSLHSPRQEQVLLTDPLELAYPRILALVSPLTSENYRHLLNVIIPVLRSEMHDWLFYDTVSTVDVT